MGALCLEFQELWGMQQCNCQLCTVFSQQSVSSANFSIERNMLIDE